MLWITSFVLKQKSRMGLANTQGWAKHTKFPQPYILLKTATANKLGKNSAGGIADRILADIERKNLYVTITGNEGGQGVHHLGSFVSHLCRKPEPYNILYSAGTNQDRHVP
jgi:hypothetical protein